MKLEDLWPYAKDALPSVLNVIYAVALLAVGWMASRWTRRLAHRALDHAKIDAALGRFFASFAQYALLAMGVIAALDRLGVQTSSLVAVFASMGIAIGLALQGSLANVASGVLLLLLRPFRIDDWVTVAGLQGRVHEIGMFATTLISADGVRITVVNAAVATAVIQNHTYEQTRRIEVDFPLAHDQDLDAALATLAAAITDVPELRPAEPPTVTLVGVRAAGVDVRVYALCGPAVAGIATAALRQAAYRRLAAGGFTFVDAPPRV